MVVLATLMHLAWLGFFFFLKKFWARLAIRSPAHSKLLETNKKGKVKFKFRCMFQPTDQPRGRKAGHVSLCTPIPVGLPGQDSESGPWKQILLDDGEVQVGGSLGEAGRARPAVDGMRVRPGPREKEGRMGGRRGGGAESGSTPAPWQRGFRRKNNQSSV